MYGTYCHLFSFSCTVLGLDFSPIKTKEMKFVDLILYLVNNNFCCIIYLYLAYWLILSRCPYGHFPIMLFTVMYFKWWIEWKIDEMDMHYLMQLLFTKELKHPLLFHAANFACENKRISFNISKLYLSPQSTHHWNWTDYLTCLLSCYYNLSKFYKVYCNKVIFFMPNYLFLFLSF